MVIKFKPILFKILFFTFLKTFVDCQSFNKANFDVREKFRECFFDGVSSTYNNIICATNWPIQFSMMITDKLCIEKKIKKNTPMSSMNINTCLPINLNLKCDALLAKYNDTTSTFNIVNETIKFFNSNGSQFIEEFPYILLRDDESQPGYFPPCQNFNSSIGFTLNEVYDIYDESIPDQFFKIQTLIYEKGPILAYLDSKFK